MLEPASNFTARNQRDRTPALSPLPATSIVVPTFREAEALPDLIDRVARVRAEHESIRELVIVDDDSRDGTEELVAKRPENWLKLIVRKRDRGLSQAVLAGLHAARGDILVVMDADLSHPPEVIANMQQAMILTFVFLMPFMLLSGLTAPISNMPEGLQTFTLINPLRYAISITHQVYLEGAGLTQLAPEMLALVAIALVTLPFSAWMFRYRLR